MCNQLVKKRYPSRKERQQALEKILIDISRLKVNGLAVVVPGLDEIINIYKQAEDANPNEEVK